jgi:hypothetical protein
MPQNIYRIRKSFLIPLTIDAVLLFALLILSCLVKGSSLERAILTVFFIAVLFVLVEAAKRAIEIGDEGVKIKKFFRIKSLAWTDITHIGCLIVRSRVYILLTTTKGFFIFSNAYDHFSQMIRDLASHISSETVEVEDGVRAQIENPAHSLTDLVAAWIAAAVMTGIIVIKLIS